METTSEKRNRDGSFLIFPQLSVVGSVFNRGSRVVGERVQGGWSHEGGAAQGFRAPESLSCRDSGACPSPHYGLYNTSELRCCFAQTLSSGDRELHFKQLYGETHMRLVVSATDIDTGTVVYFSHRTHPDLLVADAIVMSITLPFAFQPTKMENNHHMVDGARNRDGVIHILYYETLTEKHC